MAIEILAHRGNLAGPDTITENSVEACRRALAAGFGLEIDLRRNNSGEFYICHDSRPDEVENLLDSYRPLFKAYEHLPIAVNVKEPGYEECLIALQESGTFGGRLDFYFDFELLEPLSPLQSLRRLISLAGGRGIRFATRLSDRGESLAQCLSIPCHAAWADEFDSFWLTAADIRALQEAGRRVYVISPELHGFTPAQRQERWAQFKSWRIDGICTDYALEARDFFAR